VNSAHKFFRLRESGAGPDPLTLEQVPARVIRMRTIHGAQSSDGSEPA